MRIGNQWAWTTAWSKVGAEYGKLLKDRGMDDFMVWAGMSCTRARMEEVLGELNLLEVGDEMKIERVDRAMELQDVALEMGRAWACAQAGLHDFQVALDLDRVAKRAKLEKIEEKIAKQRGASLLKLPAVWKGKAYRRAVDAGDAKAQQRAEAKERARWSRRVVEIVVQSGLPFGQEVEREGYEWAGPEASRCLQGLRASTLKKRVSDFAPLQRWLRAEKGRPFPSCTADVTSYFRVLQEGKAARTAYGSLLNSLGFFEEAGEQPRIARLSETPALKNAAKEAERSRLPPYLWRCWYSSRRL